MGIREAINQNKKLTMGVTVVLVVVAVAVIVYQLMQPQGPVPASGRAFYTIDGGQTWFTDDGGKLTPYDKDGKAAVIASVWTCNGKPFVTHLERLAPDAKKKIEELQAKGADTTPRQPGMPPGNLAVMTLMNDREVRDPGPGDGGWVKVSSPEGRKITAPECPEGSSGDVEPVAP